MSQPPEVGGPTSEIRDENPSFPFLSDVVNLIAANRSAPIGGLAEAWLHLAERIVQWRIVLDRPEIRRTELVREQLVAIAALAWKAAQDLGIESRAEAIGKDIPF